MTLFVFLGPSLPLERARELVDAEFLPPVAMGDVYVLLQTRARRGDVIAIIDGLFEQVGAVWHKEILHALAAGVEVHGASSMGALRAAELHPFGMRGAGRIFEDYRDGVLTDDDDVAVAHALGDGKYRSLSVAMVSLRYALAAMRDAGVLLPCDCHALLAFAKSLPYALRSWGAVLEQAREQGMPATTIDALRAQARLPDAKAQDAEGLLRQLAARVPAPGGPPAVDFCFNRTAFWAMLEHEMQPRVVTSVVSSEADHQLAEAIRTHSPHRRQLEDEAVLLQLAQQQTATWTPDPQALRAAAAALAHRHGLSDRHALDVWRQEQAVDAAAWNALLGLEARREHLLAQLRPGLTPYLPVAARRAGLAGCIAGEAARGEGSGVAPYWLKTSLHEDEVDVEDLQRWYVSRCGPMLPDPERHAHALGFSTLRDFVTAIAAAYRAGRGVQQEAM